jgi:hypothetical protein
MTAIMFAAGYCIAMLKSLCATFNSSRLTKDFSPQPRAAALHKDLFLVAAGRAVVKTTIFARREPILLDAWGEQMVNLVIRSRAKKLCGGRSLKI